MKILQVCNKVPYPLKDGGALAIHNLTKGFSDAGAKVCLLCMNTSKHRIDRSQVEFYFKEFNYVSVELVDVNTDIRLTPAIRNLLFSDLPYNAERFINGKFNRKLEDLLLTEKFDIVQFEGLYLMPYAATVRKYTTAKIALRAHNVEYEIWQRNLQGQNNPVKKLYLSILTKRLRKFELRYMNEYDLLVPITRRDALKFNGMGNNRPLCICPYGFILSTDTIKVNPDFCRSFFFIGSLDWIPNQQGIIWFIENVWSRITSEIKGSQLFIAGRNAPQWLKNMLQKQNISFLGEVENAGEFMKDKGIMIVPLFSGSGMRVKIVEALAAGKAVITTNVGAEGIDVSDNQDIMIADNSEDFLTAAKKLCFNKDFYLHIAKNAIKFVAVKLDNSAIVSKLLEFYKMNI